MTALRPTAKLPAVRVLQMVCYKGQQRNKDEVLSRSTYLNLDLGTALKGQAAGLIAFQRLVQGWGTCQACLAPQ